RWPRRYWGGEVYGHPVGVSLGMSFRRFRGLVDGPVGAVTPTAPTERLDAKRRAALGLPAKPVPAAIVPIWVTVDVPAGARAGMYAGTLAVSVKGRKDVAVPIELEVFDWALPALKDRASELSIYQSPDTVAAFYKVPLWSRRHWALMERSVKLLGEIGNHTIAIPLVTREQLGHAESFVRVTRKPDGSYDCNTAVMDRYLDLYLKHHDRDQIDAVCLLVWGMTSMPKGNPFKTDKYVNGWPSDTRGQYMVTTLDPKTGQVGEMPLPPLGSAEYKAFWRQVLAAARASLARRGLADKMLLGLPADPGVPVAAAAMFHDLQPDVGWFLACHPGGTRFRYDPKDRRKTVPVVHSERVYTGAIPDPAIKRLFGWQDKQMKLAFNRYGFGPVVLYPDPSLWALRVVQEADLAANHRGAGRLGADYWTMTGAAGKRVSFTYRYLPSR
ncbi:hypothetical protein LCGC14_2678720, partial [marine sediment metagenome]